MQQQYRKWLKVSETGFCVKPRQVCLAANLLMKNSHEPVFSAGLCGASLGQSNAHAAAAVAQKQFAH